MNGQYLWRVTDNTTSKGYSQYVGTLVEAKDAVRDALMMLQFPKHFTATIERPHGGKLAYVPQMRPGYKFTWKTQS